MTVFALLLVACSARDGSVVEDQGQVSDSSRTGVEHHVSAEAAQGGNGSADRPFATLAEGLAALAPGDTLVVAGGTYDERIRDPDIKAGRPTAPITVQAAPGERVVLRGLLWLRDASWWRISGINVTWHEENRSDQHMVKFTDGTGWIYEDAEVWGARSYAAILVAGSPKDFTLRRLHVHSTHLSNGTNQDHLIYLNSGTGGGVVERCLLVGSPNGRAIKIGSDDDDGDRVANLVIRYNTMVDNTGPSNVQLAYSVTQVTIERNIMVGTAAKRENVTAYRLNGSGNLVHHNIGWESAGVVEPDVALLDGPGNRMISPELDASGRPRNPEAAGYGHLAVPR